MSYIMKRHTITMGPSTGPVILLFKRFKAFWKNILISNLKSGIEIQSVAAAVLDFTVDVSDFAFLQLEPTHHQREDYRELLDLTLMFLGRVPPRTWCHSQSTVHVKIDTLYALKIVLFRDAVFQLTKREAQGLVDFWVFGVVVFIKSWFLCRLPTAAPANDLNLLKLLVQVESPSAKGAIKKLSGQLWYHSLVKSL